MRYAGQRAARVAIGRIQLGILAVAALSFYALEAGAYIYVHEVLPGENLRQIAKRYRTTVKGIRRRNRLRRGHLRAGRKLKIISSFPCRTLKKVRYVVRRGDSLSRIAKRHKMKLWRLRRLNRRAARRALRPGQKLWVVVEGPRPGGRVKGLYQLTSGPGYHVRDPRRAWGTFATLNRLHDVLTAYGNRFSKAPAVRVMDISRRGGGLFPPHKSHRRGRDVDIAYPKKKKYRKFSRARPRTLHLRRTWFLLSRFIKTGGVKRIFMDYSLQRAVYKYARRHGVSKKRLAKIFQYPRGVRRTKSPLVLDEKGHDTHFHVRFLPKRRKHHSS